MEAFVLVGLLVGGPVVWVSARSIGKLDVSFGSACLVALLAGLFGAALGLGVRHAAAAAGWKPVVVALLSVNSGIVANNAAARTVWRKDWKTSGRAMMIPNILNALAAIAILLTS